MKICVAQIRPFKGDLQKNIDKHKELISLAVSYGADTIVFPELSLTGYEPALAKSLSRNADDSIFDDFQQISNSNKVTIGVGMPTNSSSGILISMIIFQPGKQRQTYSKQFLHEDELPYFVNGQQQVILPEANNKIAPAICYESLLPEHSEKVFKSGANIYIASVAKSSHGIEKALKHFPAVAHKYSMTVLMANSVGPCDNFVSAGRTSVWNDKGELIGQLDETDEGILIIDTETQEIFEETIETTSPRKYSADK